MAEIKLKLLSLPSLKNSLVLSTQLIEGERAHK